MHPQKIHGQADLERSRPNHVQVGREVHETLGIDAHEVDDFSDGRVLACSVRELQSLSVDGRDDGGPHAHANDEHAVEVLAEDERLEARGRDHDARVEESLPHLLARGHETDEPPENFIEQWI